MNLFVEELTEYVIEAWGKAFQAKAGQREARFILQSLGPLETLALFERLDSHAQDHYAPTQTRCYFRTAKALWEAWDRSSKNAQDAIASLEGRGWIDQADQLTWYRNRLARDEGTDGLVVVLVGLNHATDQGGLSDFHVVDEHRIQETLGGTFLPWLERIGYRLGLNPTETQLNRFDDFLRTLSELRPLQLGRLATFLQPLIDEAPCYDFDDFRQRVLKALPHWGIPPILASRGSPPPDGKEAVRVLKEADAFISHLGYKAPLSRKRDLAKLQAAINEPYFAIPLKPDGSSAFLNKEKFYSTLEAFIQRADPVARDQLLAADAMPIINALRRPSPRGPGRAARTQIPAFDDLSIIVFFSALWDALIKFEERVNGDPLHARLGDMTIQLVSVEHDYRSSDDVDDSEGVRRLLTGLLGGLNDRFVEVAEAVSGRWDRTVRLHLEIDPDDLAIAPVRGNKRPSVLFQISVADDKGEIVIEDEPYRWFLDATQPERVRHDCIDKTQREWSKRGADGAALVPAFRVNKVNLASLFYASDGEEANRLLANAMQDMELLDLLEGLPSTALAPELLPQLKQFTARYRKWLDATSEKGYYSALQEHVPQLISSYIDLVKLLLDNRLPGAGDLLFRVYKMLLLIGDDAKPSDPYLESCVAWGLSPAVLELSLAQARFLADGFPQVLDELSVRGRKQAKPVFERLLSLSRIQRPITVLVRNNAGDLTTRVRGFGLIHCAGEVEPGAKSLAVQTLLKEDESDNSEELRKVLRPCAEQRIVLRVLSLYRELHHFAADGLRILAANVSDLSVILLGVQQHLEAVLKENPEYPPFQCTVMVYSASASPLGMENRLSRWREEMLGGCKEGERPLLLTVGHRYAPLELIIDQLERERHSYDLAFLFHFLRTAMNGKIEAAAEFDLASQGSDYSFFPIVEYPRPIQIAQHHYREMLLSNRRLMVQTRHADLSARLRYRGDNAEHHLVLGQVDFGVWAKAVEALHQAAHWVSCIDSFVDKSLLLSARPQPDAKRKVVGFESGLGDYGELNLTISTEQDTLAQLTRKVSNELSILLPHQSSAVTEQAAERIVANAEKIAGLASLRAVLGRGQQIREVMGYAAINRMLKPTGAMISQLLPLDAMQDWLSEPDTDSRPDLLQLSLHVERDGMPLIEATVIECKLANQNSVHTLKALKQVRSGLFQLTRVLAPRCELFAGLSFDRRYWWAQLQRAIASRGEVSASGDDWNNLNHALERVVEGQYRICWRGMVFTFWTDVPGGTAAMIPHQPSDRVVPSSVEIPAGFRIEQVVLGHQGLARLFEQADTPEDLKVAPASPGISIGFGAETEFPSWETLAPDDEAKSSSDASVANADHELEPATEESAARGTEPAATDTLSETYAAASLATNAPNPEPDSEAPALKFASATPVPHRILIGTRSNGEPVYWHYGHPKLQNRHLLIFGTSGSGKTYGIQCLLGEMASAGLRSLIVDYTDGFLPAQMEPRFRDAVRPRSHFVVSERLPLNPFRRQRQEIDPSIPAIEENNYQVASRIVSIFASVYNLGEQQLAALSRSLQAGLENGSGFSFDGLLPILQEDSPQGLSLANKIEPFIQARPFVTDAPSSWGEMLRTPEHGVHVLQLKGLGREIQRMVTEFVLWDLWDFAQSTGSKDRPIPIVLDEIQNLDHSSDSPIDKMLREGRKFGLSLMLATQTTSNFNNEQRDRLFQAGHKLFFKPATTETDRFAQILAQATTGVSKAEWAERLARLEKGQCWSLGAVQQPDGRFSEAAMLVSVTALEKRALGE